MIPSGIVKNLKKLRKFKNKCFSYFFSFPKTVECNICGWKGRHFLSSPWQKYSVCPICDLEVRHRLLIAALTLIPDVSFDKIVQGKKILHFAPETGIKLLIEKKSHLYNTVDYIRDDVDFQTDVSDMINIKSETFDLVILCDVLEEVENDKKAVSEIYRVLKAGGCLIITVPQKDDLGITFEDPDVRSPKQREKLYGDSNNFRMYGRDFEILLQNSHFNIEQINSGNFSEETIKKYVLFPPVLSFKWPAGNYRTIYFAFKPNFSRV